MLDGRVKKIIAFLKEKHSEEVRDGERPDFVIIIMKFPQDYTQVRIYFDFHNFRIIPSFPSFPLIPSSPITPSSLTPINPPPPVIF